MADKVDAWNRFTNVSIGAVYLRLVDGVPKALHTICPHLGCFVDYRQGKNDFFCPCHNSNFKLDGIATAPRGMPQIEVSFDIDANGILHVSATDKKTGKEQKITIKDSSGLSEDEIERMKREAEENAEADKQLQEEVEARNEADTGVYAAEKFLKENGENLSDDTKGNLEKAVEDAKEQLQGTDLAAIKTANEKLQEVVQAAAGEAYKAATEAEQKESAESPEDNDEPSDEKKDDGPVVEAEVVDEDKK